MINFISDAAVITKRQLQQLTRVPELLLFSTIQPIMFVLLFRYVFGGSIDTGQPGGYVQLLMPGIFVQTVAFTLAGTAVGLAADMQKGLIDRFRSLPISRSAFHMCFVCVSSVFHLRFDHLDKLRNYRQLTVS